jgi:hypothetical protein
LGLPSDSYDAYCLDQACQAWGEFVRSSLEAVDGKNAKSIKGKQDRLLHRLLMTKQAKKQFADPMDMFEKKGN